MALDVWQSGRLAGTLDMRAGEPFYGFTYAEDFLACPDVRALSLSLPLREERFSGVEALPFFEGLLPEGGIRDTLARQLHVSPNSPAQLLRALGRDCAGDVVVIDEEESFEPPAEADYLPLPGVLSVIANNPHAEVAKLRAAHRLSLAGGQEKVALYHDAGADLSGGWYAPTKGSPSTHIIKPQVSDGFPHLALNEFLCMHAAAALGIPTAATALVRGNGESGFPLLVVERYDRELLAKTTPEGLTCIRRIHQEDLCQALGLTSDSKYEHEGSAYVTQIANLLLHHAQLPTETLRALFRLLLFNYLVGNCDAHLKNYSLLPAANQSVTLAPAYDLISTTVYRDGFGQELSRSCGIRIGSHLNIDRITPEDLRECATALKQPARQMAAVAEELLESFDSAFRVAASHAPKSETEGVEALVERILADSAIRQHILERAIA